MANYVATARTNYFEVQDKKAFEEAMSVIPSIELATKEDAYCIFLC